MIIIITHTSFIAWTTPPFKSEVLVNVTIENSTESELKVTCKFKAGQKECMVIWHRKTEKKLKFVGISLNFTIIIPIHEPGEYSVAVFGRKGGVIEQQPFQTCSLFVKTSGTCTLHLPQNNYKYGDGKSAVTRNLKA